MNNELTTGFGDNSISLRDGASALFRRKGLVLFIFLAVVLGTAAVTLMLPNKYESRMKILVKNQRLDVAITPEATGFAGRRRFAGSAIVCHRSGAPHRPAHIDCQR